MTKKVFSAPNTVVVGPYSPAVDTGNFVFLSGQIPIDTATGKIIDGDISAQTEQCFKNLISLLEAGGLTTDNVVKSTVYLTDMVDYAAMNEIYAKYFKSPYPARTAISVVALPLGSKVEIDVIAQK